MKLQESSHISVDTQSRLVDLIIDGIQDIKGKNIVVLDMTEIEDAPANFFVICEGDSNTQVRAIGHNIHKKVKESLRLIPHHTEGALDSKWVLIDYFDTVVHVFYPETRAYYDIENLWSDARRLEIQEY